MTLSQETINSLPVPKFSLNKNLVTALEKSESTSKVYKQNAGSAQENVKHSFELISRLNSLVMPGFAEALLSLHENSDISIGP